MKNNKIYNEIPDLMDKLTLIRSKVYLSLLGKRPPENSWKETRVMLNYLLQSTSYLNHEQYIDDLNDSDTLEKLSEYLVMRIVPKEK